MVSARPLERGTTLRSTRLLGGYSGYRYLFGSENLLTTQQQPTEFWLDTFPLTEVFEKPELITSLAHYSENRPESACPKDSPVKPSIPSTQSSLLFLRIRSAADFYTTNKTLMSDPPLVNVDISKEQPIYLSKGKRTSFEVMGTWIGHNSFLVEG